MLCEQNKKPTTPTVLTTQPSADLSRTRFTTLRSELCIKLKIDADALNRRRRRLCVRRTIYPIHQGQNAGKCACVYGICSVNNKIQNETNHINCTYNLSNLNSPNSFKLHKRLYHRKHNGIAHFYYHHVSQRSEEAKYISI
jgi:hypothetical protein